MTPKQKAENLIMKFYYNGIKDKRYSMEYEDGKQCALLCVDEMQEHAQMIETPYEGYSNPYQFLKQVKQEINKL